MSERTSKKRSACIVVMLALLLPLIALTLPKEAVSASLSTCSNGLSGCHFTNNKVKDGTARNTPAGTFLGTHARHSGYSTSSTKREYVLACTKCHGLSGGYSNSHQTGFKNVSGSSLPGNRYSPGKKIANTNTPTFGNCSNIACHSSGRATGMGLAQYSSVRWGGTKNCLGCHGGRTSAAGSPARSVGNFTLSTTHSQHLKYPAADINCQICHSKTVTDAATLKSYSGVVKHNNGVRNVTFTGITYGTYTSYKSTEVGSAGNTKTCANISCHGGKSRNAWSATSTNNNNVCVHCHGVDPSAVLRADKYNSAPGWGGTGTSTDQVAVNTDNRVGAHFVHLSSVYMPKLKCNECHSVPSTPFSGTHMATPRYNSQTLTFAQASTANNNATTPAKTDGTAVAPAACTTTFCHGSNMVRGDTSGTARSPLWNQAALMTGTPGADCGTCHGNPPTAGTTAATHSGKTATTSCSGCHSMVVDGTGKIINKTLHLNGTINVAADCNGCHKYDVTGTNAWQNTTGTDLTHFKHITFIKGRLSYGAMTVTSQTFAVGENAAVCGTCHTQTLAQHNDGTKQITFGAGGTANTMGAGTANSMSLVFGGSNPVANGTTGVNITCSNLMCHYATTPNWY